MLLARLPLDPTATVLLPSPDGSELFLVETRQRRLLALDAEVGRVRESTRSPRDTSTRSLRDEFARFLAPSARAASSSELRAALSPDGRLLYAVFPTITDAGDGLWVFATATLQPVDRLLLGWLVHGVVVAPDGTLVAVTDGPTGDRLVVLDNDQPRLIVTVPERITEQLK
jgi:DNA-binding beta-propeller fold protein YncE